MDEEDASLSPEEEEEEEEEEEDERIVVRAMSSGRGIRVMFDETDIYEPEWFHHQTVILLQPMIWMYKMSLLIQILGIHDLSKREPEGTTF